MTNEQILAEIREANPLPDAGPKPDSPGQGRSRVPSGVERRSRGHPGLAVGAQVLKLASRNTLLCSFRVDDNLVWSLLTNHTAKKVATKPPTPARQHPDGQPRVGSAVSTPTSRSSPSNPTISRKPAMTATPTVAKKRAE